jgi:peptidoglycan hydrolase-like protein with peptidoglycan-binding domain
LADGKPLIFRPISTQMPLRRLRDRLSLWVIQDGGSPMGAMMTNGERILLAALIAAITMAVAGATQSAIAADKAVISVAPPAIPDPGSPTFMTTKAQIRWVQAALARNGQNLPVDGYWGHGTTQALRAFQKAHQLKVTGYPDRPTLDALAQVQ